MKVGMNKKPEITDQTRANLLEAFWMLYTEKRIDRITVKEIAQRAGYNRGTFYEYFDDVYQCLDQIEELALPRFDELPPVPGQYPAPDLFESFIMLYREKYRYYDVLLGERGDPSFQRRLIDSIKATILDAGGGFPSINRVELDYFLEYMLSGMTGILRYYFHSHPEGTQAEMMALVYRMMEGDLFATIRQQAGMKALNREEKDLCVQ